MDAFLLKILSFIELELILYPGKSFQDVNFLIILIYVVNLFREKVIFV